MDAYLLLMISPLIALFFNVSVQIISVHITSRVGSAVISGFAAGFIADCAVLLNFILSGTVISLNDVCVSLLTYLALSFCFWAFLNLNITSLRIRLMRELLYKQEHGLRTEELLQQYSPQELVRRRIERLARAGQIAEKEGYWKLQSRKLLYFERIFFMLNKLIIPSKTGGSL